MSRKRRLPNVKRWNSEDFKTILWIVPLVLFGWFVLAKLLSPNSTFHSGMTQEEQEMVQNSVSPQVQDVSGLPKKIADAIDEDLKEGHHRVENRARRVESENGLHAQPITYSDMERARRRRVAPVAGYDLSLKQYDSAQRVYDEVRAKEFDSDRIVSAEDRINSMVAERQWLADHDEAYVNEFIQSYKEAALKDGYEVNFNSNMEIIGFRPVNKKDEPLRIPQAVAGESGDPVLSGASGSR